MSDIRTLDDHPLGVADSTDRGPGEAGAPMRRLPFGPGRPGTTDWRQTAGFGAVGLGAIGIVVAWFQIAGERELWKQLPYLASGGIGGAGAIAIGIALLIAYEHSADRAALEVVLDRLDDLDSRLDETLAPSDADGGIEHRIAELEAALRALRKPARTPSTRATAGRAATPRNGR